MLSRKSLLWRAATTPTLYLILGLIVLASVMTSWIDLLGGPNAVRERFGIVAPLVSVSIHIVLAITPFPSDFISITNGALYGFAMGAFLSWVAWWIAAILEFFLGFRARRDFQLESKLDELPVWLRDFPIDHPVFLIGARQIPWIGGHITTFLPGAAGVRPGRYLWCSAIAIVPGAIVMPAIGAGLMKFQQ